MRTVTLTNLIPELVTLNLPAQIVPEKSLALRMGREASRPHHPTTVPGGLGRARPLATKDGDKRVGGSLTFTASSTPGSYIEGLPPSVLLAPEVAAALKAKKIKKEIILTGDDVPKPIVRSPSEAPRAPRKTSAPVEPPRGTKEGTT